MNEWFGSSTGWYALGFAGQLLFTSRFFVQWLVSERSRRVVIPEAFWYLSLCGSALLLVYAIHVKDPVFIVGQSTGSVIYVRNLVLIKRDKAAKDAAA